MSLDVRQTLGLALSESELRDALRRLAFFAPSGSGQYTRDLHDFLALQALSMLPTTGQAARSIYNKVSETVGPKFEFEEILDALRRLVATNQVQCSTGRAEDPLAQFQLPIETRNELRDKVKAEEALESEVLTAWKERLTELYPELTADETDNLAADLKLFAIKLLSQHSIETIQLYYGDEESLLTLLDRLQTRGTSDIWEDRGDKYDEIRQVEVIAFFHDANEKRKQYIASLMHSLFILQLTNLDPHCAAIVRPHINGGVLYLDTNFVIRLVGLQGPDLHRASRKLVEISQQLGYTLVISPRTEAEYLHTLRNRFESMATGPSLDPRLAALAVKSVTDEDFYSVYWRQVSEKGPIDPRVFYDYYQHLEALLSEYGIVVDRTFHDEISANETASASEAAILRATIEEAFGAERLDRTSDFVIDHDVYHRLLIRQYRKGITKETFSNARAWFITFDTKLPLYDRVARRKESTTHETMPFCVLSGQWLQTIRPFVGQTVELDIAQVDMTISSLLRAYPRPPNELINDIISRLRLDGIHSAAVIGAMLTDKNFLERFRDTPTEGRQDIIDEYFYSYAIKAEKELAQTREKLSHVEGTRDAAQAHAEQAKGELSKTQEELERERVQREIAIQERDRALQRKSEELESERIRGQKAAEERDSLTAQRQRDQEQARVVLTQARQQTKVFAAVLVGAAWLLYILLRLNFTATGIEGEEWVASVGAAVYVAVAIWRDVWKSWLTVLVPAVLVLSLFAPDDWAEKIQIFEAAIAAVLVVYPLFQQHRRE